MGTLHLQSKYVVSAQFSIYAKKSLIISRLVCMLIFVVVTFLANLTTIKKLAPKITHYIALSKFKLVETWFMNKLWLKTRLSSALADSLDLSLVRNQPAVLERQAILYL